MFELTTSKDSTVHITGELLIHDVEEFYNITQELLNNNSPATFDLSGLTNIDVSALQVFLSYKRSLQEESKFAICAASDEVKKIIKLTGLAKPLHVIV